MLKTKKHICDILQICLCSIMNNWNNGFSKMSEINQNNENKLRVFTF